MSNRVWWAVYRDWYFSLSTLGTSAPWDTPKGKRRVYTDGTFSFHESEIAGNFDEIEEALFAFRNGLSDVVFEMTIHIPKRIKSRVKYVK